MKASDIAMTNDEAINNILSLCENGTYHEWTVTDPDCLQMRRNLPSGEYQFIELWDCPTGGAIVVSSTIDLSDYSEGELWFYGSPYYESQADFEAQGADIAAECVFEQRGDLADVLRTCETPESIVPTFLQILNSPAS